MLTTAKLFIELIYFLFSQDLSESDRLKERTNGKAMETRDARNYRKRLRRQNCEDNILDLQRSEVRQTIRLNTSGRIMEILKRRFSSLDFFTKAKVITWVGLFSNSNCLVYKIIKP